MAKNMKSKGGMSGGEKVGIGVALTTAAVAAAGAYFLYGSKDAAQNRRKVRGWALKAKGELLERLEQAGNMTAEEYQQAVEKIVAGYAKLKHVSAPELATLKKEMMSSWKNISGKAKVTRKTAKKVAKKATKAAKKAVK